MLIVQPRKGDQHYLLLPGIARNGGLPGHLGFRHLFLRMVRLKQSPEIRGFIILDACGLDTTRALGPLSDHCSRAGPVVWAKHRLLN